MAEFQDLEIRLRAVDDASEKLQKVVDLLEKVKSLSSNVSTNVNVKSNTSSRTRGSSSTEAKSVKALNAEYEKAKNNLDALIQKQNTLNSILRKSGTGQSISDNERNVLQEYINSGGKLQETLNQQVISAQEKLAEVQKKVNASTQQQSTANQKLSNTQNTASTSTKNLKDNQKNLDEQNKSTAKSFVTLAAKITTVVRVFRRLTTGLFSAIKESGEFVENLNLFAVTFGENYQETLDWALEFADNLGVASNEIVRFTGLFKQLADSIGVTQETATEMSQVLTQLGYDLASFYNISTESAFEKLQAGIFSGQTKPLRSLGLDVTQQTLDNLLKTDEAFKDLGVTSSKALLQSDKAMLRLIVVLQNAQNSFGDINRTIRNKNSGFIRKRINENRVNANQSGVFMLVA